MADENQPTHYRVTVKSIFHAHNEMFRPGDIYTVTAEVYRDIKDQCATAKPVARARGRR